jgi:plastocyanin
MIRALCILAALGLLSACTGGGYSAGGGGTVNGRPPPAQVVTIDVNLTQHGTTNTPYGMSTGYAPPVTTVSVGTLLQFKNSDGFPHTATAISGAKTFPTADPFTNAALTQSGSSLSGGFSSGALAAGATSQMISVDKAGVFLFGCFFHYASSGMRAAIVAQ